MRFNTPLRYPGGKGKLTQYFKGIIDKNNLNGCHYAEPFAGGAGLALNLLAHGYVEHIYLNDINPAVYAFWYSVLHNNEALCSLIESTNVTMDEWYKQRDVMSKLDVRDLLVLGFSAFFLNRTNRSGILLGGVIGGKKQDGSWKLDARFNKDDLIKRIRSIGDNSNKVSVYNLDAIEFIDSVVKNLPEKSLTYIDPPYYVKGEGLYENHYGHNDHVGIANKIINEIKSPWVVSYDNVKEIDVMYAGCKTLDYELRYSAQERKKGKELMFFSEGLRVPKTQDPAKYKA
ncbi:DNA adenine methylase [Morganella morganii]|uniref:DNA adenine methylase n=1 Tax=Morganella morganii TaxID=582 RepID=UPI00298E72CE|nr:DNA adenine methylase [Morganella morganii]MDW7782325.1 DNA adenine methylase [Morganella morganii]MDW7791001.1 DNA adenine methylase [Morganella morganii]HEO9688171.1 DNA adenine methylase [Morganella morganii subsp. morganii]